MSIWVTSTGFVRSTLQELRTILENGFKGIMGEGCDVSVEGPNGDFITLLAEAVSDIHSGGQEIYASHDPSQASGMALDVLLTLRGLARIAASYSTVDCILYCPQASNGLVISSGKQVKRTRGGVLYSLLNPATISNTACRDIYLKLNSNTPGDVLALATTFGTFSVTMAATEEATYGLLVTAIQASAWDGTVQCLTTTTSITGAQVSGTLCLRLINAVADFGVTLNTGTWQYPLIGSVGKFQCDTMGYQPAVSGEIYEIATPVSGWSKAYNQVDALPGRDVETDSEARIRMATTYISGYATEEAVRQNILNRVDGIISASISSNRTMVVNENGLPPKSFEVVVDGGLDADIGAIIWECQPAGIQSYANMDAGGVQVVVLDSQNVPQTVYFTRPVTQYLWIWITYSLYDEESFPTDGVAQIKAAIIQWAESEYSLGKNIIPQRILIPVYTIPGLSHVDVTVALTADPSDVPMYTANPIPVGSRERASASESRIVVMEG